MKAKKIQISIFLILANFIFIHAQNIKTYTGVFENGNATYSYFENESYERIYQGKFTYNENVVKYEGLKLNITGSFINNVREGDWTFVVKNTKSPVVELVSKKDKAELEREIRKTIDLCNSLDAPVPYAKIEKARKMLKNTIAYQTYNSELKGGYLKGKQNGKWTCKILTCSKCQPIISMVNFNDNKLNGDFSYTDKNVSIIGKFSESGKVTGKWIIKWKSAKNGEYENIREYENGELKNMIERNLLTGDLIRNNKENLYDDDRRFPPHIPYREGYGIKLMIEAIEFWLQPKDDVWGEGGLIDDASITKRNYSFKFDRGIIKPINPFVYHSNPSIEEVNKKEESE